MASSAHKCTILLVDDEEGIRNVLNITLGHAGYHVLLAPDGDRGLALFRENLPEIVITDIKMPGIDGIELLRTVKKINPDTEVIMITGHGDMDLAVRSLQYEAADFITKPIDSEELEQSVEKALERFSINTRLRSYMNSLQTMIREKERELDESESLVTVGQTVAGMSHVIKNIAGGLKGASFILEQGIETENREYLVKGWHMMKGNIDKITNLSLDLLNYAKTGQIIKSDMDPVEPVRDIVSLLTPRADMEGITLSLSVPGEQIRVRADREAIYNTLFNLVSNAMDACGSDAFEGRNPPGAALVKVSVHIHGDRLVYRVEDNGAGMEEDIRNKLFNVFVSTKGNRGTGFGLMTAKKIVAAHHGKIMFDTRKGQGSVFSVELPLAGNASQLKENHGNIAADKNG